MAELVITSHFLNGSGVSTQSRFMDVTLSSCHGQGSRMALSPSLPVNLAKGTSVSGPGNTKECMWPHTDYDTLTSTPATMIS